MYICKLSIHNEMLIDLHDNFIIAINCCHVIISLLLFLYDRITKNFPWMTSL